MAASEGRHGVSVREPDRAGSAEPLAARQEAPSGCQRRTFLARSPDSPRIMKCSFIKSLVPDIAGETASDTVLAPAADALAKACRERDQPKKSLASFVRSAKADVPPQMLDRIHELTIERIDRIVVASPAPAKSPSGVWLDIAGAAGILNLRRATLTDRLKQYKYRQLYGWPFWDGHQWWFSSMAVDPATRAESLATLPAREPIAHAAMLPEWCEQHGPDEGKERSRVA